MSLDRDAALRQIRTLRDEIGILGRLNQEYATYFNRSKKDQQFLVARTHRLEQIKEELKALTQVKTSNKADT